MMNASNTDSSAPRTAPTGAVCGCPDRSKGVVTLRNTLGRFVRGVLFAGVALIVAQTAHAQVAGTVTDFAGLAVEGAVVEVWDSYPSGSILSNAASDVNGEFSIGDPGVSSFDLRVCALGHYPTVVRSLPNSTTNTVVKLAGVPTTTVQPLTSDYWSSTTNTLGSPIVVGDVVEAHDPDGVVIGVFEKQLNTPTPGSYLLHTAGEDGNTPGDQGALPGDDISFFINGLDATPTATWVLFSSTQHNLTGPTDVPGATVTAPKSIGGVQGDAVLIQFLIKNTGTVTQSYDVSVDVDSNWTYSAKSLVGPLDPGSSEVYDVLVNIPGNAIGGFATATVHATAQTYAPANSGAKTQIDVNPTGVTGQGNGGLLPNSFSLAQNFPNPFNPETQIAFNLKAPGHVRLEIFNVVGQSVALLLDGYREAGIGQIVWDGRDNNGATVASGIYFYRLSQNAQAETRKMVLLR